MQRYSLFFSIAITLIVCSQVTYGELHDQLAAIEISELELASAINHASTREERAASTAEMAELCAQKAILLMRAGDTERALKYCRLSATHFENADFYNNPIK